MKRRNQSGIEGVEHPVRSLCSRLDNIWIPLFLSAAIILTSCSKKENISEMSLQTELLSNESKKQRISEMTLQIESLSMESEYHADENGVYQLISKNFETRYQGLLNKRKVIDKVVTDEELPDRSAGEFTSFSLHWNEGGSVSIRQLNQTNMDDSVPGAAPWIWDKTYELELVKGTREDFEAGQTISLQYTEASLNQVEQDLLGKIKDTYGELTAQVIRQASLDKGLEISSIETETEVVSFSMLNTPMEVSKSHCKEDSKNSQSVEIRTILSYKLN